MGLMRDVLSDLDSFAKDDTMPVAIELGAVEYEEGIEHHLIQEVSGAGLLFGLPVRLRKGVSTGRFYLFCKER